MAIAQAINKAKHDAFVWRTELSLPLKVVLSLVVAAAVGLLAQWRFYLPWTAVPITGQTFGVLLAGVMLGRVWGGISLAMYVAIGIAGVPWFAPQAGAAAFTAGGIAHLTGATGGFLIGFVLAALFLGYFTDKFVRSRSFVSMFVLMLVANFVLIYGPGLLWLGIWLKSAGLPAAGIGALLTVGMIPFIPGDITKAAAAAAITRGVTPKTSYTREVDAGKWAHWRLP